MTRKQRQRRHSGRCSGSSGQICPTCGAPIIDIETILAEIDFTIPEIDFSLAEIDLALPEIELNFEGMTK